MCTSPQNAQLATRTHPVEDGPDLGVEADGDSVERPVEAAAPQPLALAVRVERVVQLVGGAAVQRKRAQLIHRLTGQEKRFSREQLKLYFV